LADFLSTLTSLRLWTVYPSGSVPSFSIRIGQRLHRDLDTQHLDFGFYADVFAEDFPFDM
jgi:hypothetical protein